jgi:hypothetical protein
LKILKSIIFLCLLLRVGLAGAQVIIQKTILGKQTVDTIKIDGELNEKTWIEAEAQGHFRQNFPYDTTQAFTKTIVRVSFDKEFVYIAAECFDDFPDKDFVISSLRRDFISASDLLK